MTDAAQLSFDGAVALVRHPMEAATRWLTRWDSGSQQLQMIMADRLVNETAREAIDRELAWELRLDRRRDYLVSSVARLNFAQTVVLPGSTTPRDIRAEFFIVNPYGQRAVELFVNDANNFWLTREELFHGVSEDGRCVSVFTTELLRAADVIGHSE